jgi:hypothetical protein
MATSRERDDRPRGGIEKGSSQGGDKKILAGLRGKRVSPAKIFLSVKREGTRARRRDRVVKRRCCGPSRDRYEKYIENIYIFMMDK